MGAAPRAVTGDPDIETIELALLLEGFFRRYGFDFRNYAHAFVRRRVAKAMGAQSTRLYRRVR